jgi:hypothetical protein
MHELGNALFEQCKLQTKSFYCCALTVDERNYIIDTVQLMMFICDINCAFSVREGVASLCGLNGTVIGEYLFLKVKKTSSMEDCCWQK